MQIVITPWTILFLAIVVVLLLGLTDWYLGRAVMGALT